MIILMCIALTFCILVDFPIHTVTISMGVYSLQFKGQS